MRRSLNGALEKQEVGVLWDTFEQAHGGRTDSADAKIR